ncbi:hypothetical protein ABN702_00090 [Bacillus haimaensis]|uniref:hypothetical protein n=1 Tax=Bacillus haimaensis TaxID=3160967 RepID=UPI003AA990EC
MEFAKKVFPAIKRPSIRFKKERYATFFETYWLHTILFTCISSTALGIPAFVFKFGYDNGIPLFYLLALLIALPWFLVPSLYLLYIGDNSKRAKGSSYSMIGILIASFFTWIICLFQL